MINDEIDRLRLATTSALLSGRRDVVVVSSVSCLYAWQSRRFPRKRGYRAQGMKIARNAFLRKLVADFTAVTRSISSAAHSVSKATLSTSGSLRRDCGACGVLGDEVESVITLRPEDNAHLGTHDSFNIYPANLFVTSPARQASAIAQIQLDLGDKSSSSTMRHVNSRRSASKSV